MVKKIVLFIGIVLLLTSVGCININLFEKQVPVPSQRWSYGFVPEFKFSINDTVSRFRIFAVIRHTDRYQFNNIWLRIGLKGPGTDSVKYQNMNLQLADNKKWFGEGVDDIYEVRVLMNPGAVFKKAGDYTFSVAQIMRENPLPDIMNVGIRIEKIE